MTRVRIKKVCVSEDGNQICMNQGASACMKCAIFSGQKFKGATKRLVLFKGVDIPEVLRKLI